jgi:hypothetical protein
MRSALYLYPMCTNKPIRTARRPEDRALGVPGGVRAWPRGAPAAAAAGHEVAAGSLSRARPSLSPTLFTKKDLALLHLSCSPFSETPLFSPQRETETDKGTRAPRQNQSNTHVVKQDQKRENAADDDAVSHPDGYYWSQCAC